MPNKHLTFRYDEVSFEFEIDSREEIISKNIESTGCWEKNQLCLYKDLIGKSGVFVDIGANVGINSIFAKHSLPMARVIAVEPEPQNFATLARNVGRSGIELHNLAIAATDGEIGFAGTGTNAHLTSDADAIKVPCVTLDGFTQPIEHIDLMKIDVEGFTDLVLSEAGATLPRVDNIIIEFSYGDIELRLRSLGHDHFTRSDVIAHSEELFDALRPHFKHFYYISRSAGLIEMQDTKDLFEIMLIEAAVGDILATKAPVKESISDRAFAFGAILELKQHNHLRMAEIQVLYNRIDKLEAHTSHN